MPQGEWQELKRIDLAGLIEWLQARPPDEVVGLACSREDCPIARHAARVNGSDHAWVNGLNYGVRWRAPSVAELDGELRAFVEVLDGRAKQTRPVTAGEALGVATGRLCYVRVIGV